MYLIQNCKIDLRHPVPMPLGYMPAKRQIQIANSHTVHVLTNPLSEFLPCLTYVKGSTLALQKIDYTLRLAVRKMFDMKMFPIGKCKEGPPTNNLAL